MAKINKPELFTLDQSKWNRYGLNKRVTVGNNRTIELMVTGGGDFLRYRLHDNVIAIVGGVDKSSWIALNHCGHLTSTTIAAMNEFLGCVGSNARVSRAGGVLSVRGHESGDWQSPSGSTRFIL
jgi:hypothetical protein